MSLIPTSLLIPEFAQLGKDSSAQQFLASLDNHPEIGGLIDSISYFEAEQDEVLRKSNGKVHRECNVRLC